MKKVVSFVVSVLILLSVLPLNAFAASSNVTSGKTGDCTWELNGTVLTISGNGKMGNYNSVDNKAPWGKQITIAIIETGVTSIGNFAFYVCTQLTDVTIPDSVTSVSLNAFGYCGNLKNIKVEDGNSVYYARDNCLIEKSSKILILGCANSIIPDDGSVNTIGYSAFIGCTELTSIAIPDGITTISGYAFEGCVNLRNIVIPASVSKIREGAFINCGNITKITVEKNDTYHSNENGLIESKSRILVRGYANGIIPADGSVKEIGYSAFSGCSKLTSIVIPDGITTISTGAFSNCVNLKNIVIPASVSEIGMGAFDNCGSIVKITVENNNTYHSNENGLIETKSKILVRGYADGIIPADGSVKEIWYSAFSGYAELTNVTIPDGVTSIDGRAFRGCVKLHSISIPDSVTNINQDAFFNTNSELVIYTSENSVAHKYARQNVIKVYLTKITRYISQPKIELMQNINNEYVKIVLEPKYGYEYSCNDGEWQKSNVFDNLLFNTDYIFYQRLERTNEHVASSSSEPTKTHTIKRDNTDVSIVPEVVYKTAFSVQLKKISGYEYSKDGINWQKSNVFNGLEPNKTYTFYQRIEENDEFYESKSSLGVTVTTLKESPNTPDAPIIISRTNSSVTLQPIDGYEYKMDNGEWQESNIFSNVEPNKIHIFYQRFAETDTAYAGESSPGKEAYTFVCFIAYNANGGTSAPEIQEFLSDSGTISDIVPQRDGYSFFGWNMLDDFITIYQPGDTIDMTRDLTLYAMWAKKCESCNATGKIQVKDTSKCSDCEGDGVRKKCSRCGSYNVTYHIQGGGLPKYWQCNACKSVNSVTGVSCISCNGTGIYVSYHTEICNECSGSGHPDEISPVIIQFTDTKVVLQAKSGYEYSQDGIHFQKSNVFENLLPSTTYSFYQRKAQIGSCPFGVVGPSIKITTDKSQSVAIPSAPTIENVTADTIVLKYIQGYEYSKDGNKWDSSPKFTGLSPATEYTFYQRVAATNTSYAGKTSPGAKFKTDKGICKAPSEPVLQSKTHNTVILQPVAGCEYSIDGVTWQTSNQFTGLDAQTNYFFYQRYAESDRYYASSSSKGLTVRTNETPKYVTGDLDGDNEITDSDVLYLLKHTFRPEKYPINQPCDYNNDGKITDADAVYLLKHIYRPEKYPLSK